MTTTQIVTTWVTSPSWVNSPSNLMWTQIGMGACLMGIMICVWFLAHVQSTDKKD